MTVEQYVYNNMNICIYGLQAGPIHTLSPGLLLYTGAIIVQGLHVTGERVWGWGYSSYQPLTVMQLIIVVV